MAWLRRKLYELNTTALTRAQTEKHFLISRGRAEAFIEILAHLEDREISFSGQELTPDGED